MKLTAFFQIIVHPIFAGRSGSINDFGSGNGHDAYGHFAYGRDAYGHYAHSFAYGSLCLLIGCASSSYSLSSV